MAYSQLFQGILKFSDTDQFEAALARIASGESVDDDEFERRHFRESLIGGRILKLHFAPYQPATSWEDTTARLRLLASHAIGGILIAAIWVDAVQVEVIHANHRVTDYQKPAKRLFPDDDYFPMYRGARYTYREKKTKGGITNLWWAPVEVLQDSGRSFYEFRGEFMPNLLSTFIGGDLMHSAGNRLYSVPDYLNLSYGKTVQKYGLQMIADADAEVGSVWMYQTPGDSHLDLYCHKGFEDVETLFETFYDCLKLEWTHFNLKLSPSDYPDSQSVEGSFISEVSTLYFAMEVGLVKVLMPDGELNLRDFDPDAGIEPGVEPEVD